MTAGHAGHAARRRRRQGARAERRERPAVPPQLQDRRRRGAAALRQLGRAQRGTARKRLTRRASQTSSGGTSASRRYPSPAGPKNEPGATITPASIHSAASASEPQPQEERRVAACAAQAHRLQRGQHRVALGPVALAHLVDVRLVVPGRDRRPLEELRRRDADVRPVLLQRGDDLGIAGDEPRAVAGHRRALRQRVEHNNIRAVADLQRGLRRVAEPQLRVGLVGGEHEAVAPRQGGRLLVERQRGRRARRVVRVVQPQDRDAIPVDALQRRQPAVLLAQRQLEHLACRRTRAPRS